LKIDYSLKIERSFTVQRSNIDYSSIDYSSKMMNSEDTEVMNEDQDMDTNVTDPEEVSPKSKPIGMRFGNAPSTVKGCACVAGLVAA
jgi:hypothetical protein